MNNNSLINNSKNENIFKRFSDDNIIDESIASKYADYLDDFSYNISNKNNDSESLIQNEMINESEMNNLFNDDFISKNDSFFKLDQDSVLKDVQINISQILKKKNLSNSSFSKNKFQEKDFSFNSKNFLSFLEEEDDEGKSLLDEIEESMYNEESFDKKKNKFFENFLVLKKRKNKKKFMNNFSLFYKLEHISKNKFGKDYYVFENGAYNSKKNTENKNLLIGRLDKLKNYVPNDIIIPNKTISRLHCQLISKNYFRKKKLLKKKYLHMINSLKKKNINNGIICIIFKYLIKKNGIYLQDLNSITGTYLKLKEKEIFQIKEGDNFLLGAEANFNVIFIKNRKNILLKIRKKIKIDLKNTVFFGFESKEINTNILLRENFILLETNNCSSNLKKYIIIKALNDKEYLMGRREVIDIKINLQDISRVHCKIFYKENKWFLIDGDNGKKSINGTWINLKNKIKKKKFGQKVYLDNGAVFKISDDIFVFHNKF